MIYFEFYYQTEDEYKTCVIGVEVPNKSKHSRCEAMLKAQKFLMDNAGCKQIDAFIDIEDDDTVDTITGQYGIKFYGIYEEE